MFETIVESLRAWNKTHGERAKLQYAYFVSIIGLVLVAGLVSLLNVDLGRRLLGLATILSAVWVINAVAWALLQSFVLTRLNTPRRSAKSTTKK